MRDIGAIGDQPDFSQLTFATNNSVVRYGASTNALISFLNIAIVVHFLIVKPMNMLVARATPEAEGARLAVCPECLQEISLDAIRARTAPPGYGDQVLPSPDR